MEGPIIFWGYKEQESNLILPEPDDDDEDDVFYESYYHIPSYSLGSIFYLYIYIYGFIPV